MTAVPHQGGARTGQGTDHPPPDSEEARDWLKSWHGSVIELTHNHGTEDDPEFSYHDGNSDPVGFGHVGFLCDNLTAACDDLAAGGVPFHKKPLDGTMRGLAFALDPDGEAAGRSLALGRAVHPMLQRTAASEPAVSL